MLCVGGLSGVSVVFRVLGLGFRVCILDFRVLGLGFRVFRVYVASFLGFSDVCHRLGCRAFSRANTSYSLN